MVHYSKDSIFFLPFSYATNVGRANGQRDGGHGDFEHRQELPWPCGLGQGLNTRAELLHQLVYYTYFDTFLS